MEACGLGHLFGFMEKHRESFNKAGPALTIFRSLDWQELHGMTGSYRRAQAKAALNQAGIDFEEIDLSGQLQLLDQIKALTGRTSVPQVQLRRTPRLHEGQFYRRAQILPISIHVATPYVKFGLIGNRSSVR